MTMSDLLNSMQTGNSTTFNGMVTNSTSLNECVNFFFTAGALRNAEDSTIIRKFSLAFNEDPLTAMKLLFWARDIRGGAGERRLARIIYTYLAKNHPEVIIKNMHLIPEYGRWDDLLIIVENFTGDVQEQALNMITNGLISENKLCAKWMPRPNGKHKKVANIIRKHLKLTPKEYRKILAGVTDVIETKLCIKDYGSINYEHVPSIAMHRYQNAFMKNDSEGFGAYKDKLKNGEAKINAEAIYPHQVVKSLSVGDNTIANSQWNSLPNYMSESNERIMPMCDVSESMSGIPMEVSVALGIYISERNLGPFKDHFITFTSNPTLQKLSGSLSDRYLQISGEIGYDTDISKAFDSILTSAVRDNVSAEHMPTMILILSDMEFNDYCISGNSVDSLKMIQSKYEDAGYKMPKIVYWNIDAKQDNVPVKFDETGTALVSGYSPSILTAILKGEEFTPIGIMKEKLNEDRYKQVKI